MDIANTDTVEDCAIRVELLTVFCDCRVIGGRDLNC